MRDGATGRSAAQIQREVLSGGDALHPFRSRDRVHVSLGGGLQRVDQAKRAHLLEYAQLYFNLNGRLRLRAQEGRAGLEKIIVKWGGSILPARRIRTCAPRSKHLIALALHDS